jgi:hypothetical protein
MLRCAQHDSDGALSKTSARKCFAFNGSIAPVSRRRRDITDSRFSAVHAQNDSAVEVFDRPGDRRPFWGGRASRILLMVAHPLSSFLLLVSLLPSNL